MKIVFGVIILAVVLFIASMSAVRDFEKEDDDGEEDHH